MEQQQGMVGSPKHYPIRFHGKAGDYFGIVFVNAFLKIITLGIYSPWAKVRELQYFYGNTELAGGSFQFTANPLRMLLPRIIAFALFVVYFLSDNLFGAYALWVLLGFGAAYILFSPLLVMMVASFRLRHSVWRGINFSFNRDYGGAYRVYFLPSLLTIMAMLLLVLPLQYSREIEDALGLPDYETTEAWFESWFDGEPVEEEEEEVGSTESADWDEGEWYEEQDTYAHSESEAWLDDPLLDESDVEDGDQQPYVNTFLFMPSLLMFLLAMVLIPYFDFIHFRYLARNVRFGDAGLRFDATAGHFYVLYGWWLLASGILLGAWVLYWTELFSGKVVYTGLWVVTVLYLPASAAYLSAKRYNLVMNNLWLAGRHSLLATLSFPRILFIRLTNLLAIIVSMGLLRAWAKVRLTRYVLEHTTLRTQGSLDEFVAGTQQRVSALADEISDSFDLEIPF